MSLPAPDCSKCDDPGDRQDSDDLDLLLAFCAYATEDWIHPAPHQSDRVRLRHHSGSAPGS